MAKIAKVKISATKRAQHLKNKKKIKFNNKVEKSSNKIKNIFDNSSKSSSQKFVKKNNKIKNIEQKNLNNDNNNDELLIDNVLDCFDENDDDIINYNNNKMLKSRKRKYTENINNEMDNESSKLLEKQYTNQAAKINNDKKYEIDLLPIKNKDGTIISRTTEIDFQINDENNLNDNDNNNNNNDNDDENDEYEDSDDDILQNDNNLNNNNNIKKSINTTDLLILRQQEIEHQKYRIGIICSGILEKPEDKIKNIQLLFNLLNEYNENDKPNLLKVRKLACLSICELFKDILPEYRVGQIDPKMIKIRKTTLERIKYENLLLQQFKKYLQILEKITSTVIKKNKKIIINNNNNYENIKICHVAVQCLCEILISHSYFNYVQNIAQLLVYLLNCNYIKIRQMINKCFRTIFIQDKRLDMTLYIIRRLNHLIKMKTINNNNINIDLITCFISLNIQNINLDAEKENELKQKKLESHRQHLINLSKKEKKRRKRLTELNRELQEINANDNKKQKNYKLTEIIKMIFTIYFRILKIKPNTKLLSVCLEGLAKYSHIINIEYFSDLVEILNNLLNNNILNYRDQLYCIQTIFKILSGQGQILNIDPIRFYNHLYRNLLIINCNQNHNDYLIILNILNDVLIKRRKNITQSRLLAFIKRILIISMHLLHNGTLGSLCIIKIIMQLTSNLDIILDTDNSIGSGKYNPELNDPEYCNANCTSLYELNILRNHYHPTVKTMAINLLYGAPASGEGSLLPEIGKLSPTELFEMFDTTEMAFKPTIQIPNKNEPKFKKGPVIFLDQSLQQFCKEAVKHYNLIDNKNNILKENQLNFFQYFEN